MGAGRPERVRAVLFDLDNTLVDLLQVKRLASMACARAMVAAGAELGLEPDAAGDLLFQHYLERGIESDDAFETFLRRNLRNKMGLTQNAMDRVLAAGVNAYLRTKDTLLAPYPGVPATLVALTRRGYRLGVVTDAPRLKAWQRLWAVGLADFFETVITRRDAGAGKPDEAPFRIALDALGLPPHAVAMVGDWPERDVAGANRVGLFTVLARYGRHGHDDVVPPPTPAADAHPDALAPDATVERFPELLGIFASAPPP